MSWLDGWDYDMEVDDIEFDDVSGDMEWDYGDGGGDSWWSGMFDSGGGGDSGGNGWMGLLWAGANSYMQGRREDKKDQKDYEQTKELMRLKQQLEEETYQKRQQELKDAYGQYAGFEGPTQRPMGLLSNYSLPNTNPGARYYG